MEKLPIETGSKLFQNLEKFLNKLASLWPQNTNIKGYLDYITANRSPITVMELHTHFDGYRQIIKEHNEPELLNEESSVFMLPGIDFRPLFAVMSDHNKKIVWTYLNVLLHLTDNLMEQLAPSDDDLNTDNITGMVSSMLGVDNTTNEGKAMTDMITSITQSMTSMLTDGRLGPAGLLGMLNGATSENSPFTTALETSITELQRKAESGEIDMEKYMEQHTKVYQNIPSGMRGMAENIIQQPQFQNTLTSDKKSSSKSKKSV